MTNGGMLEAAAVSCNDKQEFEEAEAEKR